MFEADPKRTGSYEKFVRETPAWFADSGLGIFVHWGAYSVPAWAEPIGALGAVADREYWFAHNPYAEWYFNTIRIDGSPARVRHDRLYGGAPYDDFLDDWKAEDFDPAGMVDLFARAGARYIVPTTKHHDGIALWDAPGTDGRNTVGRGPRRDLVGAFADAARDAGLRFGVYYSSGLDWHAAPMPVIRDQDRGFVGAPQDLHYARYVNAHVRDLIDRYRPDMLWGDIEYPTAGEADGPDSFVHVLEHFYATAPEGVVNDRWGRTHWDFRCSEYEEGAEIESADAGIWQRTRGIGYSFGYNRNEGAETHLTGSQAIEMLVDVASRGGNLLLNVGPDAAGRIPEPQQRCLEGLAAWMSVNAEAVHGVRPFPAARASDDPWIRWTARNDAVYAIVRDGVPPVTAGVAGIVSDSAEILGGDGAAGLGPRVIRFARR